MNENYSSLPIEHRDIFYGNLYFFYSFDIGDDIDLKAVYEKHKFARSNDYQSKFFKSYHKPMVLDIDEINLSEFAISAKIYNFGVVSLRYKFSFHTTLDNLRRIVNDCDAEISKKSIEDARIIFNELKEQIRHSRFFHLHKSYATVQIEPKETMNCYAFKERYGNEIVSVLRFETETLSHNKKNEILDSSFGYYRGDLIIIDQESALIYDNDYLEVLDIFEFANVRHMELQYFDKTLDKQLNFVYERQPFKIPFKAYIPFYGMFKFDPIGELAKLRVDISVVSERLWSSIKFSNEPYYLEIYQIISKKLDFEGWQESINKKMEVIRSILETHENRVSSIRYDIFNILIVLLILIECILGVLHFMRS